MEHPTQFGPWKVEKTLNVQARRCYLVCKSESQPLHFLKPATPDRPIHGEVEVLERLTDHPNIITLVDYDLQAPIPYHVTEYCSGGQLNATALKSWSLEELSYNSTQERFQGLFKAVGYAHSQGVLLGDDIEVFLTDKKEFVIGDIEAGTVWETYHLDTTDDLRALTQFYHDLSDKIKRSRVHKIKQQDNKRQVDRALAQAQPSAPRRLAK